MGNEIYNSSNWGTGVCDNTIDWGIVYKNDAGCTPSFTNAKSLSFDGVDDYTKAGITLDSYNNAVIRTFSFWVKINTLNTYTPFFSGLGATGALFRYSNMCGVVNGKIRWQMEEGFASSGGVYIETEAVDGSGSAPNVADGNWHHVVVYNAVDSTANKANVVNCKVYLDGSELTNNIENTGTQAVRGFPKGFLCLGTCYPTSYLEGNIDEFAYWDNHELSASNVTTIYNSGSPTDLSLFDTPPTSWYRMGDSSTYKTPQILMPSNENKDKVSNYSFSLDGVDDYIDCGNISELNNTTEATWSIWAKKSDTSDDYLMSCYSATSSLQQYLFHQYSDKIYIYLVNSSGTLRLMNRTDYTFNVDEWYHIGIIYNEAEVSNSDKVKVYINGVLQINQTTGFALTSLRSTTAITSIGRAVDFTTKEFGGNIDEVAIWDNDQSANISTISATPLNDLTSLSPVAYWKLGEEATFVYNVNPDGTWTIPDQVGSNNGTSNNQMADSARVGTAPSSSNNAVSFNMVEADIETDTP